MFGQFSQIHHQPWRGLLRWRMDAVPGWVWWALLGAGMILGGLLVTLVALTRVVLPYDEAFVGLTRAEMAAVNPRLLPFMMHDRVSLAGTMFSIGVLYWYLARYGVRQGARWAWETLTLSSGMGFASFFLFLGYGYFDPLHACVAVLLFVPFCLGVRTPLLASGIDHLHTLTNRANLSHRDETRLRLGRAIMVAVGVGLLGGGSTIAAIGVTDVFVAEDLAYMQTTPDILNAANPRLIPLIAHDRAGFGGALVSNGVAVLLVALWGLRSSERPWVWWALLWSGLPGFGAAIGIHLIAGYTDLWHLAPALGGMIIYLGALVLLARGEGQGE